MRGNHADKVGVHVQQRSIPACAGEPRGSRRLTLPIRVYPRVCGGTDLARIPTLYPRGLSPRVRGNQQCYPFHNGCSGSIPACAGEPQRLSASGQRLWVYPRVCGGTNSVIPFTTGVAGLSPRVRGNLNEGRFDSLPERVYPRVCGGTSCSRPKISGIRGLSPRVRGNHCPHPKGVLGAGSIPACAGEPHRAPPYLPIPWVYPRVCGGTSC